MTRCRVDGAGEFTGIGSFQDSDDFGGVPRALVDVGGDVGLVVAIIDDGIGGAVVVRDKPVGGFDWYCSLGIKLPLKPVNCCSIEVGLVGKVDVA